MKPILIALTLTSIAISWMLYRAFPMDDESVDHTF